MTDRFSGFEASIYVLSDLMPPQTLAQLSKACDVIERHLASSLLAVHLYGSALDGGLKPFSDVDLLVTVNERLDETVRQALFLELLDVSVPPGQSDGLRALEVTVVVHNDVVPWRYPARREFQFGEWLRGDIAAGIFEPPAIDIDLAILLTKARQCSVALIGPEARVVFDSVPEGDFIVALNDTLNLWNAPPDWAGDERNVVLTLARIWYSAATGKVASKDVAADWAIAQLPTDLGTVLLEARQAYVGLGEDRLATCPDQLTACVRFVKGEATKLLNSRTKRIDSGETRDES